MTGEVFALNNMFSSIILCMLVSLVTQTQRGSYKAQQRCVYGAFVCGLSLTNQHSLIFFVLPSALVALYWGIPANVVNVVNPNSRRTAAAVNPCTAKMFLLACVMSGCVGVLLYVVYLPYGTGKKGSWGDGSTVLGMSTHILRREYGTFMLHPDMVSNETLIERTTLYVRHFVTQTPIRLHSLDALYYRTAFNTTYGVQQMASSSRHTNMSGSNVLVGDEQVGRVTHGMTYATVVLGALSTLVNVHCCSTTPLTTTTTSVCTVRGKCGGYVLLLLWLFYVIFFHALSNIDLNEALTFAVHARFWMQPNVIMFVWYGLGVQTWITLSLHLYQQAMTAISTLSTIFKITPTSNSNLNSTLPLSSSLAVVLLAVVACTMRSTVNTTWHVMDQSRNTVLEDEIRTTMLALPQNSLVLLRGDHITNVMRYLQTCVGVRPDLHLMSDQLVKARWFVKQEHQYPGILFPPRRYILDEIFGFSLEHLIALNINHRPVLSCDRFAPVHVTNTLKGMPWGLCERIVINEKVSNKAAITRNSFNSFTSFDDWWNLVRTLQLPNRNFTKLLNPSKSKSAVSKSVLSKDETFSYIYSKETWEYKLYEKIFEKQQATIATMVNYAQQTIPSNFTILKLVKERTKKLIFTQDLGPFIPQSATWKNLAVSYLMAPNALESEEIMIGGLSALCEYLKHRSKEVDKDPQLNHVEGLVHRVASLLKEKHEWTVERLVKEVGWIANSGNGRMVRAEVGQI